ncbi:MAG: glycosyltransferase family 2 protein [Bradyrhizobium sp.]|nr:glycosyltransferase family 2 protein [Bradyrhizobium sp.]
MVKSKVFADVWVVIAAYNEARAIALVLAGLAGLPYRLLVVDDGSTDGTADVAGRAGVEVLRHPINLGQGAALQTGIDYALLRGASHVVTFDADGQHRPEDIAGLLAALAAHQADFALGSRFRGVAVDLPPLRRLMLRAATWFTRLTTGLDVTDAHNGLLAMTRAGAGHIRLRQNRMAHASEILHQIAASGLRYVEAPVTIQYSRYSLAKGQRASEFVVILLDLFARRLHP